MAGKSDACFSGISAAPGRQKTKVAPWMGSQHLHAGLGRGSSPLGHFPNLTIKRPGNSKSLQQLGGLHKLR